MQAQEKVLAKLKADGADGADIRAAVRVLNDSRLGLIGMLGSGESAERFRDDGSPDEEVFGGCLSGFGGSCGEFRLVTRERR